MNTTTCTEAQARPGSVRAYDGATVEAGAHRGQYPLFADCATCRSTIACASPGADWGHTSDQQFLAAIRRYQAEATGAARVISNVPWAIAGPDGVPVARIRHLDTALRLAQELSTRHQGVWDVRDPMDVRSAAFTAGKQFA